MKGLFIVFLLFFASDSFSQNIDKQTSYALERLGLGYIQQGYEELIKAAGFNSLAAQFYVAICYEHGIGVEKNDEQAFRMFRRAAERGLPDAMLHLASYYKNGIVVAQNSSRANEWLQRYNQKGGKLLLPDLIPIYNEGLKHTENYALNPNGTSSSESGNMAQNTIPVVAQPKVIVSVAQPQQEDNPIVKQNKSDVDLNIPISAHKQDNTFALIIANENYQDEEKVPNAINDGAVFAEYCEKTIGIPQSNIKYISDATLNGIRRQINWLLQVMDAFQGQANVIVYYAGHGIPDESNKSSYILPVDGFGTDVSTGYSLDKLYTELSSKPAKSVIVLLDACFSGTKRDGEMLASARGVAIKVKQNKPQGNIVVLSAAQGDETAYPYKEKEHGMFTYYLLKKLQETKGDVSFGELVDYISTEVKKRSIIVNGKMQTPTVNVAPSMEDKWKDIRLN